MTHNKKSFINAFNGIARHKHRYKVFEDFVTMSAISFSNAINKNEALEKEYMDIVGRYSKDEVSAFCQLLAELIKLLEFEPIDILGQLYMELEISNKNAGQFFTPDSISQLMGKLIYGSEIELPPCGFVTLSEPTCGAGGMVLAFVKEMIGQKLNPMHHLWVQCIDIDRTVALMCYVQLSLWNVPAQIIVGNTLTLELREQFFTPAYYLFNWDYKLKRREKERAEEKEKNKSSETKIKTEVEKSELPSSKMTKVVEVDEMVQFDMFENL